MNYANLVVKKYNLISFILITIITSLIIHFFVLNSIYFILFLFVNIFFIFTLIKPIEFNLELNLSNRFVRRIENYLFGLGIVSIFYHLLNHKIYSRFFNINNNFMIFPLLDLGYDFLVGTIFILYLISFYPGFLVLIYSNSSIRYKSTLYEKVLLSFLISIIYITLFGSVTMIILRIRAIMDIIMSFLISLIIIALITLISSRFLNKSNKSNNITRVVISTNDILIALLIIISILLSYSQIMFSRPYSGLLFSDPANYIIYTNRYIHFREMSWVYIGTPIFLYTATILLRLPYHYTFAILQFIQGLIPLSIWILAYKITKNKEISLLTTLFSLFLNGVTSLILLTNLNKLINYLNGGLGEKFNILYFYLFVKTGAPTAFFPHHITSTTFDLILSFASLTYIYLYIYEKGGKSELLLASLFLGFSFFFHTGGFNLIVYVILFFLVFIKKEKSKPLLLVSMSIMSSLLIDLVTGGYFLFYFLPYRLEYMDLKLSFNNLSLLLSLFFSILILSLIFKKRHQFSIIMSRMLYNKFISELGVKFFKSKKVEYLINLLSFLVTIIAIELTLINIDKISHVAHWKTSLIYYPLYFIIFKYFGFLFTFFLIGLYYWAFIREGRRKLSSFINVYISSIIILSIMSIYLPQILPPALIYYRYMGYLLLPISIYSSEYLNRKFTLFVEKLQREGLSNRENLKNIFLVFSIILLLSPIQTISEIHSYEVWDIRGKQPLLSQEIIDSINWMNENIPLDSTIFVLSYSVERILVNFVYGIKVVPTSHKSYKVIMESNNTTVIYNELLHLGVDYIYTSFYELSKLKQQNVILYEFIISLREAYMNDNIIIYEFKIQYIKNFSEMLI